jgi:hypothetical protein
MEAVVNREMAEKAFQVSLEVVKELALTERGEWDEELSDEKSLYVFKKETTENVVVYTIVATRLGRVETSMSLTRAALLFVATFESLFNDNPDETILSNSIRFEISRRGIDMPTLINPENLPLEALLREYTKMFLNIFVTNIPIFSQTLIDQAYGNSMIGFVEHFMNPSLKEHWQTLGLPKNFSLIDKNESEGFREFFAKKTLWYSGDKKQLLNKETLADEASQLLKLYQKAKARLTEVERDLARGRQDSTIDKLKMDWSEVCSNEFTSLNQEILESLIQDRHLIPSEMVVNHLADYYTYHPVRIKLMLAEARRSSKERKNRKGNTFS